MTEAELLCDRIGLMYRGNILDEDTKENLYTKTGTDNLKDAFLDLVDGLQEADI
jgi:ABC-type Na+ transport system ATPase subunit NatA